MLDDTQQSFSTNDALDAISVLDLIDSHEMTDSQRESILLDLAESSLVSFYIDRLPQLVTEDQMKKIAEVSEQKADMDSVTSVIVKYAPNYPKLLMEHTRLRKVEFLIRHYQQMKQQAEKEYSEELPTAAQTAIRDRITTYTIALGLVRDKDWIHLAKLFQGQ